MAADRRARPTIASLTGIRGAAALWVMAFHFMLARASTQLNVSWIEQDRLVIRGWSGVDLFFVLSGFVLMYAHGDEFERLTRTASIRFAKLRFMRLYPLNWAVLLLIVGLCAVDPLHRTMLFGWTIGDSPIQAFFRTAVLGSRWLPGTGDWNEPTWSLSAEIVGYVAFPALAVGLNRIHGFWPQIAIAAAALAALALYQFLTETIAINDIGMGGSLTRMSACFVAGAAIFRARDAAPRALENWAVPLGIAAALVTLASVVIYTAAPVSPACFTALIFFLSFGRGPVSALFSSPPLLFLGRISFPLYLIHMQILLRFAVYVAGRSPGPVLGPLMALGCVVFIILVAWALHVLVERPTHKLARTWARCTPTPPPLRQPALAFYDQARL